MNNFKLSYYYNHLNFIKNFNIKTIKIFNFFETLKIDEIIEVNGVIEVIWDNGVIKMFDY